MIKNWRIRLSMVVLALAYLWADAMKVVRTAARDLRYAWWGIRYGMTPIGGAAEISSPEGWPALSIQYFQLVLSPAIVNTITSVEQTFSVPAVINMGTNAIVLVSKPTAQSGLGIAGARRATASTIGITFINPTAGNITPTASEVYTIAVITRAV